MIFEILAVGCSSTYLWLKKKNRLKKQSLSTVRTSDSPPPNTLALPKEEENLPSNLDGQQMADFKKDSARNLVLSAGAVSVGMLGSVNPIFSWIAGGAVLWFIRPILEQTVKSLRQKRVSSFILDSLFILALVFSGHVVMAALLCFLTNLSVRLISLNEMSSRKQLTHVFDGHQLPVWLEVDGVEMEVAFEEVKAGDVVIINAGEIIAVDGVIIEGMASIDQHVLTGEAQPVEKQHGDTVFAATLLLSGRLKVLAKSAGADSAAAKIGEILFNTSRYTDGVVSRGQKISDDLVVPSLLLSGLAWPLLGPAAAVAVLYVPLGSDMRATGPLTVMSFLQILSRQGILVKEGRALESLNQVDTIVFDKTGTLTQEQPTIGGIYAFNGVGEDELLRYAAMAEYRQPHPIAKAILAAAEERQLDLPSLDEASYEVGYGIRVSFGGITIQVGSQRFMEREGILLPEADIEPIMDQASEYGFSLIYVAIDGVFSGILELQPTIRPETTDVVRQLQEQGKQIYIISGDHEQPTRHLAEKLNIEHYFANTLPEDKAKLVQQLRDEGRFVCFIGDGINDAIALKTAQVSISLSGASTAATDTAHIVLMNGNLETLPNVFMTSDEFEKSMHKNLMYSLVPGIVSIGGVFFWHFSLVVNMWLRYAGLLGGMTSAMLPLLKHQEEESPAKTLSASTESQEEPHET